MSLAAELPEQEFPKSNISDYIDVLFASLLNYKTKAAEVVSGFCFIV
jgi:hypothetical protein